MQKHCRELREKRQDGAIVLAEDSFAPPFGGPKIVEMSGKGSNIGIIWNACRANSILFPPFLFAPTSFHRHNTNDVQNVAEVSRIASKPSQNA